LHIQGERGPPQTCVSTAVVCFFKIDQETRELLNENKVSLFMDHRV